MIHRYLYSIGFALSIVTFTAQAEPIHDAARSGDVQALDQLLDQGISIEAANASMETPLIVAALAGNHVIVRMLVQRGADVHARNDRGMTPLHAAAYSGSLDAILDLVGAGAKVNDNENFFKITPLHAAAEENHVPAVKALIDKGANLEAQEKHGFTALSRAGWKENWDIVNALISAGATCQPEAIVGPWLVKECNARKK